MEEKKEKALSYLRENSFCSLATVNENNEPWISDMFFGVDDNFNFYFATKSETLKFKNIKNNNKVAISITNFEESKTMQVRGEVEKIEDSKEAVHVVNMLSKLINEKTPSWPPPLAKIEKGHFTMFKVEPTWMRLSEFAWDSAVFEQIIGE